MSKNTNDGLIQDDLYHFRSTGRDFETSVSNLMTPSSLCAVEMSLLTDFDWIILASK